MLEQLVPWLVASEEAKRNWSDAYVGATLVAMTERGGKMNGIVSRRRTTGASMGRQCDRLQGEYTEIEVNLRLAGRGELCCDAPGMQRKSGRDESGSRCVF